ncbi:MAG: hypothetical protein DRO14_02260 [Thermoprotei archaeon]|nr:MAG: hypothetical protein DRO14_02260 [Thermoprotei archaeon]
MTLRLSLSCRNVNDCIDLTNFILNYRGVNASLIKYEIKRGCLEITIFGTNVEKANVKSAVLKAYREWKSITSWKRGSKVIEVRYLMKMVGKPFITDALIEVLNFTGIKAEIKNGCILSEGSWDAVFSFAARLAQALEELTRKYPKASHSAKALITSYAVLADTSIDQAIDYLREVNAIEISGHRVLVKQEWRHLLRELLQRKIGVGSENRSQENNG